MSTTMRVIVDADACPRQALQILAQLQPTFGFRLMTVASFHHQIDHADHIRVSDEPEAADLAIVNRTRSGDIVVTQDWGLAALVLGRGAIAVSPRGHIYDRTRVEFWLEERHAKAKFRRGGGRTRGPSARTQQDDQRFSQAMHQLLAKPKHPHVEC